MDLKPVGISPKKSNKLPLILGAAVFVLVIAYFTTAFAVYGHTFAPGTIINGINCGNKTVEQAKALLEQVINGYALDITDGKTTDTITAADIDLKGDFDNELTNAMQSQNNLLWCVGIFKKNELETAPVVDFNTDKLNKIIGTLSLVSGADVTDSVNARLQLNDADKYEIIPEVYGTRPDREKLDKRLISAVTSLEGEINLVDEDIYIKPTVYEADEAVVNTMNTVNKWLESDITYKFGSATEVVNASVTKDWIVIGDDFAPFFNRDKVKEFVRGLSRKYDTFGDTRSFKTGYGFDVSVAGGNYGYRINREAEIDNLVADIKSGEKKERKPDYFQEGASYDGLDIGNTYIEVDLTGQHLFLYKDGKLILQTELVSGHPAKGATPNGTYRITYCERDATLRGEDYETPVAYWMPFNGDIGLHDAVWQPKFGGDWYVKHGSHGCINLPLSMAAQIYSYAYKGMPVVCYRYGTENYNKVDSYRKSVGLTPVFDTQPEEISTQATTQAQQ